MNKHTTHRIRQRAGNTMVLVVGILALLVIVATGYVTRTHAGRLTAASVKRAAVRDDNQNTIAESIAAEIAQALFVRSVAPGQVVNPTDPAGSNAARLALSPRDLDGDGTIDYVPVRYGTDPADYDGDDVPDFPYNIAPYHVVPFTNPPDEPPGGIFGVWPKGPGAPNGLDQITGPLGTVPIGEGNPIGNPGFGDWRWLSDNEPVRKLIDPDGIPDTGDEFLAFSHWRHMTNLSGTHNAWRICRDISNIEDILVDLSIPAEQWLSFSPPAVDPTTGLSAIQAGYIQQWRDWMSTNYQGMYANYGIAGFGTGPPPANFYDQGDLDGNGVRHDWFIGGVPQDRPESEFIKGTARWNLNRVLADTDGDGFTDALWHLLATSLEGGIRQIGAFRIVDNSGMLNANTATRFVRADPVGLPGAATRGETPTDLSLAGDLTDPLYLTGFLATGFFDNPDHHELPPYLTGVYGDTSVYWEPRTWMDTSFDAVTYLGELGIILVNGDPHPSFFNLLGTADERRLYWQIAGRDPLAASFGLTPFTMADEIELRSYHGQNMPWIASRFERAVQRNVRSEFISIVGDSPQLLRGNVFRRETSEYLNRLTNPELLFDSRRKLTLYNGARNDLMPPWLWENLQTPALKIDLRWALDQSDYQDLDGDPNDMEIDPQLIRDRGEEIRDVLERAFIVLDNQVGSLAPKASYYGSSMSDGDRARELAAAFAANIVGYQARGIQTVAGDTIIATPHQPFLDEAVPPSTPGSMKRFMSVQPQPFLVEVFVGHLYEAWEVEPQWSNAGDHIVFHGGTVPFAAGPAPLPTTMVVVQIANPFDVQVDVTDFILRVFDQDVDLGTVGIPNNIIEPGEAVTLHSIEAQYEGEETLTAFSAELELGVVGDSISVSGLSMVRDDYDNAAGKEIQIVHRMRQLAGGTADVVVDRIDAPAAPNFQNAVDSLTRPQTADIVPPTPPGFPITAQPNIGADTHMTVWARASRAWELDNEPANRRNPRYVFGGRQITLAQAGDPHQIVSAAVTGFDSSDIRFGHKDKEVTSISGELNFPMQMLVKNGDFQQLGELLNVWLFGHKIDLSGTPVATDQTFSEVMWDEVRQVSQADKTRVNRLRLNPTSVGGTTVSPIFVGDNTMLDDPQHRSPAISAGARALEAFVCDGAGMLMDFDDDGSLSDDVSLQTFRRFLLRNAGRLTPGLININTAPPEVLRALPHMARMVHPTDPPTDNPFVRVAEAIMHYRERYNGNGQAEPLPTGLPDGADYASDRDGNSSSDLRGERGIASLAELTLLTKAAAMAGAGSNDPARNWRIDFPALAPFGVNGFSPDSTPLSTDVNDVWDPVAMQVKLDDVASDLEEQDLLFSGMSNLITTRSDVFTVYFRIRSFEQNPTTGVWDATDPEFIVDDSRYVMLVDRSEVNSPQDRPKILYLEKVTQ